MRSGRLCRSIACGTCRECSDALLSSVCCADAHIIIYTCARGLFLLICCMIVEVLLGMCGVWQYLVVAAMDVDVDCGLFFCHFLAFLWTYCVVVYGRTFKGSLHVRPEHLWSYVHSTCGRTSTGGMNENEREWTERAEKAMVSEQFLNGSERDWNRLPDGKCPKVGSLSNCHLIDRWFAK